MVASLAAAEAAEVAAGGKASCFACFSAHLLFSLSSAKNKEAAILSSWSLLSVRTKIDRPRT